MKEYQDRVIEEKFELDIKIARLKAFITTEQWNNLDSDEKSRMVRQVRAMQEYSDALGERIANFK